MSDAPSSCCDPGERIDVTKVNLDFFIDVFSYTQHCLQRLIDIVFAATNLEAAKTAVTSLEEAQIAATNLVINSFPPPASMENLLLET